MPTHKNTEGNILLVANWESDVGYAWWLMENFWVTIAGHFSQSGTKSFLIYPKISTIPDTIEDSPIATLEIDFADHSLKNLRSIYRLISVNNIRYIYLSDASKYSFFYLFLRLVGVKKIVAHDHTPGDRTKASGWRKTVKSLIQRIPYYTADHFISVSDFVYRRHLEVNCIPSDKCSTASNGIYPLDLNNTLRDYSRQQFGIQDKYRIVVTTGRASYYKGINFFITCANELINNRGIKMHFLFCGDGPDMDEFKSQCDKNNLQQYFTFAGKRSDIRQILPSCDIGFHASKGEVGYSLSILEYMSAGLVTIVPDRASTCNSIQHMETGLIYSHDDIGSACDMIELSLDTELAKQLSTNAIIEVHEKYDIDKTNKNLISILNNLFI